MPPEQTQPTQIMPTKKLSIVTKNVLIFLSYSLLPIVLSAVIPFIGFIGAFFGLFAFIHFIVLLVNAIMHYRRGETREASLYLFSILAILTIGFGLCTGTVFLLSAFLK